MPDAARVLDSDELELVIDGLMATAGAGNALVCGPGAEALADALAMRGIDATFAAEIPSGAPAGKAHDVVILWHALDRIEPARCAEVLRGLRDRAARAVVVRSNCVARKSGWRGDKWMEQPALEAGFRKHPLYLQLSPYEGREADGSEDFLLLQKIPDAVLQKYPLESLAAERDLHMDMLREGGRRSDAHVERYRLALQLVRPGDTVLDVACGLGYGSRTLYSGSLAGLVVGIDESESAIRYANDNYGTKGRVEFHRGDAQDLGFLADHSVDLLVSFETLEHLRDPGRLLDEARRVLRPAGRIIACVPNEWVDEHGEDPNPHHHHVYTWERLKSEVGSRFRLERAFRQVAGSGMKLAAHPRLMREFALDGEPGEAEWLIVVGMQDPVGLAKVPYVETTFVGYENARDFHVARFDRDYENPWLVKGLVSIGFRFEEREGLLAMAGEVRAAARAGSADAGAALCVEAYAVLESAAATPEEREAKRRELLEYVECAGKRPHELRWAISSLYVAAMLHLADRQFDAARRCFERCAHMDPAPFSPLLATKTIGAAYSAGLLAALAGDAAAARSLWEGGIRTAKSVFSGSWSNVIGREDHPLYFGLPEVAIAVSKASRCAHALSALDALGDRPSRFWIEVSRDIEWQAARESRALRHTRRALQDAVAQVAALSTVEAAAPQRQSALDRQVVEIGEMHRALEQQGASIARLNAALREKEDRLAEYAEAHGRQREALAAQAQTIAQMRAAFDEQAAAIARIRATGDRQAAQSREHETEAARRLAEAETGRLELQARLEAIRRSWPYRWLRRWMGEGRG